MSTKDAPARATRTLAGEPPRILVVQAPYYAEVVGGMLAGARAVLESVGASLDVVDVAGAFEMPAALRMALGATERWDGFLMLGCVVKGETDHYDFICASVCQGAMTVASEYGAPLGFGLLTVASLDQAIARSRADRHNKGMEAAHAVLGQVTLARRWQFSHWARR